ncbi:MAG: hypothetical protein ABIB43_00120 [archaeon]
MKCDVCGKKVETTFLNKVIGTYMKNKKSKKKLVCKKCQKENSKENLLKKL